MSEIVEFDHQGVALAVAHRSGNPPGLVWLGGYRSDMAGTKAVELDRWCAAQGRACLRFDYSGHGQSGGDFKQGTISRWMDEARAIIGAFADGPQILVGSSMGAWIALRLVQEMNTGAADDPIAGLLLLAPAPDFTSDLMEPGLTDAQRQALKTHGYFEVPTPYGPDPNVFTQALFEDGHANRVMTGPIDTHCPVHIIQGQADPDVPWRHAERLFTLLSRDDATIAYVRDGDHRLSRDSDIAMILSAAARLAEGR